MPVYRCGRDWLIHNLVVGENLATRQLMTKFVGDSFQILITPSIPFNSIQHILIESLLCVMHWATCWVLGIMEYFEDKWTGILFIPGSFSYYLHDLGEIT